MKGILKLNEKNQYYIWDKEATKNYDLSGLINTYRNDKIEIHIYDGYDCKIKMCTWRQIFKGYIASQKVGKQLYDDYIVSDEECLKTVNSKVVVDVDNIKGFNLTDYLFNNVDEMIEINMKIAKDTESEVTR